MILNGVESDTALQAPVSQDIGVLEVTGRFTMDSLTTVDLVTIAREHE